MAHELPPIDISAIPELARLADEVARTGQPRPLCHGSKTVAVLMPPAAVDLDYQSIPALTPQPNWEKIAEPASDEHARHAARKGLPARDPHSIAERTAGALRRYAKQPPATREEEKDAFARAVAEEVAHDPDA